MHRHIIVTLASKWESLRFKRNCLIVSILNMKGFHYQEKNYFVIDINLSICFYYLRLLSKLWTLLNFKCPFFFFFFNASSRGSTSVLSLIWGGFEWKLSSSSIFLTSGWTVHLSVLGRVSPRCFLSFPASKILLLLLIAIPSVHVNSCLLKIPLLEIIFRSFMMKQSSVLCLVCHLNTCICANVFL